MERINNKNSDCIKILKKICEELNEELNSSFCKEVQFHLQQCPLCSAYVDSIKHTIHFCQKLFDEDVPHEIDQQLWNILKLKKPN